MSVYHILGVMSGSSLDAIDYALVRFHVRGAQVTRWELLHTHAQPVTATWKKRLGDLPSADLPHVLRAHVELGAMIGTQCREIAAQTGVIPDAIASHGHTVLHHPAAGYSLQIGHPAHIAKLTGCKVITDFRSNDIAAGGQGAPLAPVADKFLFAGHDWYLNLGGIANITHVPVDGPVRAWDIAPCNQVLNALAAKAHRRYDAGGAMARKGTVDEFLLELLAMPVLLPVRRPFSLDNTWVRQQYFPILDNAPFSNHDKLATVTEFIAASVAAQISGISGRQKEMSLFVSGGGAHNTFLIERIDARIAPVRLVVPDTQIVDFKEAILMALCGLFRLLDMPNAFASVTGARCDTVNGLITHVQTPES